VDGGGIKGMFPASFLADLEEKLCEGRSVGEHFDLIAGTSTGGIIALGLASGMRASEIKRIYEDNGEAIFPPIRGWFRRLRRGLRFVANLGRYTYEREPLAKALKVVFGDRLFGDTTRRLCIPSFEGRYGEVVVFKTPHHPDFKKDWKEPIVDVALATSAAPSFFKTYKSGEQVYADGGVWANNPVMLGLVEALTSYDVDRDNIEILSISCGDVDIPFSKGQILKGGPLNASRVWIWMTSMRSLWLSTTQSPHRLRNTDRSSGASSPTSDRITGRFTAPERRRFETGCRR